MSTTTVIRAVVVPAGQGKSTMTMKGLPSFIKEADHVIDCKATLELQELRSHAQSTGIWKPYDSVLTHSMHSLLSPGDIVMVASDQIAVEMGVSVIGYYVSQLDDWTQNIMNRGQQPSKHIGSYLDAYKKATFIYKDSNQVYHAIKALK